MRVDAGNGESIVFGVLTKTVAFGIRSAVIRAFARCRGSAKCYYGSRWGFPLAVKSRFQVRCSRGLQSRSLVGRFRRRFCRFTLQRVGVPAAYGLLRNWILSISFIAG